MDEYVMIWKEFRFWYDANFTKEKSFNFRKVVIEILNKNDIDYFLILGEPEFIVVRFECINEKIKNVKDEFDRNHEVQNMFKNISLEDWNPLNDARKRILDANNKIGPKLTEDKTWRVFGKDYSNDKWKLIEEDIDLKIKDFEIIMTKIIGKFTKSYIENMPRMLDDRWLLSVMIHLLLNSISLNKYEEKEIREYNYW